MASEIQPSTIEPEFYLQPTDTIFSLKPPSASTVCRLLNQLDTKKATGLDRIPFKLLKLSSSIVGPSLAYIFMRCIDAEIFPDEGKIAKVTPLFKKGSKRELGNYLTIILRNRAEYRLLLSRQGRRPSGLKSGDIPRD